MIVKPFRGIRPSAELADRIPSPPYDVLSSDEARKMAADDPYSFLHVIKPEIDLDPAVSPYDEAVYRKGRENLVAMLDRGWLRRDERPAYYVYRLVMGDQTQTGIVGAAAVEDYRRDRIKKHEFTRPEKEDDRVRTNATLEANPGPVFLTYRPLPELNATVSGVVADRPEVDFESPDGVRHTLWVVDEPALVERIQALLGKVRTSYVADGHHRAAAAARVGARFLEQVEEPTGDEPGNYFMAAHFPSDQLMILDYNRVVADLNGLDAEGLIQRIEANGFHVKPGHRGKSPPHRQSIGMYVAGSWYLLTADAAIVPADVVGRLDVSILTEKILRPILGVGDQRRDKRIDFVGGIRGTAELEKRVDSGRDAVAFALWPTSLEEVMAVADAGEVMPPKSTWFEPKLRSGMVLQPLNEETL